MHFGQVERKSLAAIFSRPFARVLRSLRMVQRTKGTLLDAIFKVRDYMV